MRTKRFLELCQELNASGLPLELEPGYVIARGFADLGFELFNILAGERILSLYTGTISQIQQGEERHFFLVPDCDQLINLISRSGGVLNACNFVEQRSWEISFSTAKAGAEGKVVAATLLEALANVLLQTLKASNV